MKSRIPGHDEVELLEKELFRSLQEDEPPLRARRVAAAALGLGGAAITTTIGAEGAALSSVASKSIAPKAMSFLLLKWVGIGTVAGAVSLGTVHYVRPHLSSVAPKAAVTAAHTPPAAVAPSTPADSTIPAPAPESTTAARPAQTIAPAERAPTPTEAPTEAVPQPAPAAPPVTPSALAAEVRLLDEARDALAATDGPRALDALHRYGRQFPAGTLNLEATVLRIEALFMTGASSQAASLGRDFLAAHPTSTHAARVRRLLAEHTKP